MRRLRSISVAALPILSVLVAPLPGAAEGAAPVAVDAACAATAVSGPIEWYKVHTEWGETCRDTDGGELPFEYGSIGDVTASGEYHRSADDGAESVCSDASCNTILYVRLRERYCRSDGMLMSRMYKCGCGVEKETATPTARARCRSTCAPACSGKVCGPDGCGGVCGTCPANHACNADGQCVCVPACAGKTCGDNRCGGSCGLCPKDYVCLDGQCKRASVPKKPGPLPLPRPRCD